MILNFSFLLPGSSQFINKDWHKGVALSLSAVTGLLMFIFGGEKISLLGFLLIMFTLFTNFIDIIGQAFRHIENNLHEISVHLKQIVEALPKIEARFAALNHGIKFLPSRRKFLLLPPGKSERVIFLPGAIEKKEKLEEKSCVS